MTKFAYPLVPRPMVLRLSTAAELMTINLLLIDENLPIQMACARLRFHQLEAAPVVNEAGRLAGVITVAACAAWEEFSLRSSHHGFDAEELDWTPVFEIASSTFESVPVGAPSSYVIDTLLEKQARRVYVVNDMDQPVGVVSMSDVLRHLTKDGNDSAVSYTGTTQLC